MSMAEPRNPMDPVLVQQIENNVKLGLLIGKVEGIANKQDANHLVAMALQEHNTIVRVDKMWGLLGQLRILLVVPALVALAAGIMGIFYVTHGIWGWP